MTQPDGAPAEPTAIEEWVEDLMLGHFDEIQSLPAILAPHIAERITAAVQDERERITRHARVAVAIADADDRTEWQRGYRAAADRLNAILNTYTDGASDIPQETPVGATLGLTEPARDGVDVLLSKIEDLTTWEDGEQRDEVPVVELLVLLDEWRAAQAEDDAESTPDAEVDHG